MKEELYNMPIHIGTVACNVIGASHLSAKSDCILKSSKYVLTAIGYKWFDGCIF